MTARFGKAPCEAVTEHLAAGCTLREAAEASGLRFETVRTWLKRGRKEDSGAYADFADQVDEARERAARRPLDRDEWEELVGQAARKGSVAALKLWHEVHRDDPAEDDEEPGELDILDELDQVAAARARRSGAGAA